MKFTEDILKHYGTPRHSGRYPYGSGDNPYQHEPWFKGFKYDTYRELVADGLSESEICKYFGVSSTQLRDLRSAGKAEQLRIDVDRCVKYSNKGYLPKKISEMTGIPETTVRSYLTADKKAKAQAVDGVTNLLKSELESKRYLDVGKDVDKTMGISRSKLNAALNNLQEEGYTLNTVKVEQVTNPGKFTTMLVLGPKGTTAIDIHSNIGDVKSVVDFTSDDNGKTVRTFKYPSSLDSSRIMVRHNEEGGTLKDGTIELRPGVEDISLGSSSYAQVRVMVDDMYYMKGMAFYGDSKDFPDGIDVIYNSNKSTNAAKNKIFKTCKDKNGNDVTDPSQIDPLNPFGATIQANGQREYTDSNGEKKLSVINMVHDEGDADNYQKTLSSQFLSKQPRKLIEQQLDFTYKNKLAEYDDICAIQNPTIKKKLLEGFAEDCDSAAVDLKADDLPGQAFKFILPANSLKDDECYCSGVENGTTVALIRYPHSGTFEIPILTVNNKNKEASQMLGNATGAIAINHNVAEILSGADFDGDTVLMIPFSENVKIKNSPQLEGLKNFDMSKYERDYKTMDEATRNRQMGSVTNLIMDMTLYGAPPEDMVKAVKHSMVVVDAYKHQYDWQQSAIDNDIAELNKKWRGRSNAGASTIVTKAGSQLAVPERKLYRLDKNHVDEEGYKIYDETGRVKPKTVMRTVTDPETGEKVKKRVYTGEYEKVTQDSTKMAETKDAYTLVSPLRHPTELAYADFANKMKLLANESRKMYLSLDDYRIDTEAKKEYATEVKSIDMKLDSAKANSPKERQAQVIATQMLKDISDSGTRYSKRDYGKIKDRTLSAARTLVGSSKKDVRIHLTDDEWAAVDNHAIGSTKLREILNNMDEKDVREHVIPITKTELSPTKQNLIKTMAASDYTIAEIAKRLGCSESTVTKYMKGGS